MDKIEHRCWDFDIFDQTRIEKGERGWVLEDPTYYGSHYYIDYCPFCGIKLEDE